jgi:hypothetical protein
MPLYRVSQNLRIHYLLPYRGCLNVHEKNMEKMFYHYYINGNTM